MDASKVRASEVPLTTRLIEILAVAFVYFVTAKLGQLLAIEPGNVTPVWIPSGIMLALVLWRGYRIWPGIFLGAFFGNVWAYFVDSSHVNFMATLVAGASNGVGDVLCFVVGAYLIQRSTHTSFPFEKTRDVTMFVLFGALLGAAISALFGATSLALVGLIPWAQYSQVLVTWWIGDAVGVLLITPVLLYFLMRKNKVFCLKLEFLAFFVVLVVATSVCLGLMEINHNFSFPMTMILLVLIWSATRFGPHCTYASVLLIGVVSVVATGLGYGHYAHGDVNLSLIKLQLVLSIFSITTMMIHATLHAREKATARLKKVNEALELRVAERTKELELLATTDSLTGVHNRRSIYDVIDSELKRSNRSGVPVSLLMLDLDHFKSINDKFGHSVGDATLMHVCRLCMNELREIDAMGRVGGEEFMIMLPDSHIDDAAKVAERIRLRIEETVCAVESAEVRVTVSIGVVASADGEATEGLMKRADQAMYDSKEKGRNQVTISK